jgi:molybdopterin-guanine dinucleotide biosynthesis protein B
VHQEQVGPVPVIPFFGPSGGGKTTLLEGVVRRLKERGWRVAVIKHTHHRVLLDRPGKDSWRLGEAGADIVAVSSPDRLATFERVGRELGMKQLLPSLRGRVDVVLCEGFKDVGVHGVLVLGERRLEDTSRYKNEVAAVVSTAPGALSGVRHYSSDDTEGIAGLVEELAGLAGRAPQAGSGPGQRAGKQE